MIQPGRKYSATDSYRYGFNGKENDNEVKGEGNQQDYGMRICDPRLGRWFAVDPITKAYSSQYHFASNNPTNLIDPDGQDEIHFHYVTITRAVITTGRNEYGGPVAVTIYVNTTYTYLQIVENNTKDQFFVHRQSYSEGSNVPYKSQDIQFYPNEGRRKSGATYSSWWLFPDTKDTDYRSLEKITDDFPEIADIVNPTVIEDPSSGWSQKKANRNWWGNFFKNKAYKARTEEEQTAANKMMLGLLTAAVAEIAIGRLIIGAATSEAVAATKLFRSAISPFKGTELTNAGRAVTKHPEYFGFESTEALRSVYRTNAEINQLGANRLKDVLRAGIRTTGAGGRYQNGWVTYTLQNGSAASWSADGTFIGFRGVTLKF